MELTLAIIAFIVLLELMTILKRMYESYLEHRLEVEREITRRLAVSHDIDIYNAEVDAEDTMIMKATPKYDEGLQPAGSSERPRE